MLVSFIITSYNYSNYILETIKSIKQQEITSFEIIVVDDCSNDDSISILENVEGIKLIKHHRNMGQLASIITGLKEAKGEYVSIIDSDDTIMPNYIELMTNALKKYDVAVVVCNSNKDEILNTKTNAFGGWYWSPMSCGMFKSNVLDCVLNYKNTNLWKICPDKFLFNIAHLIGGSMNLNNKLVEKREHKNNAGKCKNRFWINVKNNLAIRQEALKIIKDKKLRKIIITSYKYLIIQVLEKITPPY